MDNELEIVKIFFRDEEDETKVGVKLSNGAYIPFVFEAEPWVSDEAIEEALYELEGLIIVQWEGQQEGENYGIGFYACGYDVQAQTRFEKEYREKGIHVF